MSDHALIDELRALILVANARHLFAAESWLRERVEAAVERMGVADAVRLIADAVGATEGER